MDSQADRTIQLVTDKEGGTPRRDPICSFSGFLQYWHVRRASRIIILPLSLLAVACLWMWPLPAQAQSPNLETFFEFGDPDLTESIAVGDLNGDGALDIVVGNGGLNDQQNLVYLNDGSGRFSSAVPFGSNDGTTSISLGDLNNDGTLDIIVGNLDQKNLVYLNDGEGSFSAGVPFGDESRTFGLTVGDLNADDALDIIVGNSNHENQIFLNNGSGAFPTETPFGNPFEDSTLSVAVGDLNNDSALDIVVGRWFQQNQLYFNDGLGNFSSSIPFGDSDENTVSVAVGDLNNDGSLDIMVGNRDQQSRVYWNDGLGGFLSNSPFGGTDEATTSAAVGDLNNDDALDLIMGIRDQQSRVYLNNGSGGFPSSVPFGSAGPTESVAVGHLNRDTTLDIVVGNWNQKNKVFLNTGAGILPPGQPLGSPVGTNSVIVGDLNRNGALDIIAGNGGPDNQQNLVYLNDGTASFSSGVAFGSLDNTSEVAVGDLNNDDALDLVVGNSVLSTQRNSVYLNDGSGNFPFANVFGQEEDTTAVVMGDLDHNSTLDLVVGYSGITGRKNQVYLNDGSGTFSPGEGLPLSDRIDSTGSIALGDLNSDGALDIVVANTGFYQERNLIYLNDGTGNFPSRIPFGSKNDNSTSVALGDINSDGSLDIIVGNFSQRNLIYLNDGMGGFSSGIPFGSSDYTTSLALQDLNGDRGLDLIIGNQNQQNMIYLNKGFGSFPLGIPFGAADDTRSVALGDLNDDGLLEIVVGNLNDQNQVYINGARLAATGADNAPYLIVKRPIATGNANHYSSPKILRQPTLSINYTLFDQEGDAVRFIKAFFSANGGGQWFPATPAPGTLMTNLAASPDGTAHSFAWNVEADLIKSDNVVFRLEAFQGFSGPGPYQWPFASAQTFPFRVEAEWFAKVISGTTPVEGAVVYQGGELLTKPGGGSDLTDRAGLVRLNDPTPGQPLVALLQVQEQPTGRDAHDGWAFRTYLTSLNLDHHGLPQPDTVGQPGQQPVTIRSGDPLVLFNLVVSVEWDASQAYLAMLEQAFRSASAYLYDATDGQMALGQVALYDRAQFWADADFQFSTKNTVRPYAFHGGITSPDEAHTIRLGRFWDGGSGNSGPWNEPHGYRTLIHEFGHYALYLHDEYFLRLVDDEGNFIGEVDAFCTDQNVVGNDQDATNASIMFYQYNATELADQVHNWHPNCGQTEQARLNQGEADWQTVRRHYSRLKPPSSRGAVMAGPTQFPAHLLPFPKLVIHNSGAGSSSHQLAVRTPQNRPAPNALVALYTNAGTTAIDQGLTDQQGQITIFGALPGDTLRAATFDGALAGALQVGSQSSYQLTLSPTTPASFTAQAGPSAPYLSLSPGTDGDTLTLELHDAPGQAGHQLTAVVIPGPGGGAPQQTSLFYNSGLQAYSGQVALAGVGLGSGAVQIFGLAGGQQAIFINSNYNLQQLQPMTTTALYAEDGNFELHIPAQGFPATNTFATVLPTGYVPGPLPAGKQVVGTAYEVRLSGALTALGRAGLVRLHYHPEVMGDFDDLAIYYWDAARRLWQPRGGSPGEVDNALAVTSKRLGIYALMGTSIVPAQDERLYLPFIVK